MFIYRNINQLLFPAPTPQVKIHGRFFPADEFPPQDVIDKLMPENFLGVPENWEWVDFYFRQVKKQMDENPNFDISEQVVRRLGPPI